MPDADVGIVGGGLAGSMAAAMLERAGISTVMADVHHPYPPDFRCEKLDDSQLRLLIKTGLAASILRAATPMDELWIARRGRLIEKRPNNQFGIAYGDLVNAARSAIPASARFLHARISAISTSPTCQTITLSGGETLSVRLVVLATGLNNSLRETLRMSREVLSKCHSISVGFDITPKGQGRFDFPALTYFGERRSSRIGYITLFPIGPTMRANLFLYRDMHDPWLGMLRERPQDTLFACMPNLRKLIGDFDLASEIKIRPVDLYVTSGHRQPGVVLLGDAFATSCPAAGTGVNKVLTDVERLCSTHLPRWLATDGMGAEKIASFYDDPVKLACDRYSTSLAFYMRSLAIDGGLRWHVRRWGWFAIQMAGGTLRQARDIRARWIATIRNRRNTRRVLKER
jgi:2-polyprenyl-6-methoxyphenol hydroxylase-like FAD-dependent oxidoreductase